MSDPAPAAALQPGRSGEDGLHAAWPGSVAGAAARETEFQYASPEHQRGTAMAGMWLFLATELLFFGGLFLAYAVLRAQAPAAVALASHHARFGIGTVNTVLLLTSSAVYAYGTRCAGAGRNRALLWCCAAVALLGSGFLGLKVWEWRLDLREHLFPGPGFAIRGPGNGPAQRFWFLYFTATGLHGLHMAVGVGLVGWIGWQARRNRFSALYFTPVEAVGLYWSFVDMVWLLLYPMIYLAGPPGP